jgi:methylenetetrahydrofolate dehydrogenase (NADP+)/methenyltetrahydrofolate cyclohydrolase
MTSIVLDGKSLATTLRAATAARVRALSDAGHCPGLAVVLVGEDVASEIYVRNKIKACADVGIVSRLVRLPQACDQAYLLAQIEELNRDPAIDGILVQMPLPAGIDATRVIEAVAIDKDVDGFHLLSAGALLTGRIDGQRTADRAVGFRPCTPYGVLRMLEAARVPIAGAHAVVVGRSNTVGKPMALMLLASDATVTICHSATIDLAAVTRTADILVAAVGRAGTITGDMVKPGAAVIDVGINRSANGALTGDVDFDNVSQVAGWLSPVPGGVGPMTIAMLLENTVLAAERAAARST